MSMKTDMEEVLETFTAFTEKPENFLSVQDDLYEPVKKLVKKIYDFTKNEEVKLPSSNALPELIIEDFDVEQIWQQIELQNEDRWTYLLSSISKFLTKKNNLEIPIKLLSNNEDKIKRKKLKVVADKAKNKKVVSNQTRIEDENETLAVKPNTKKSKSKKKEKGSIVDDKFFKLQDMEEFLDAEDKAEMMKDRKSKKKSKEESSDEEDDDDIDYFADSDPDDDNDDEKDNPKYGDFFDDSSASESDAAESNLKKKTKKVNGKHNGDLHSIENDDDEENFDNEMDDTDCESDADLADKSDMKKVRFDLPQPSSSDDEDNDEDMEIDNMEFDDGEDLHDEMNENSAKGTEKESLSQFQLRQERLKKKIGHLENNLLEEKAWMMKGEVDASNRPQNSLLEQVVDFDMTSRPAPVITEETTLKLEDIIVQRIKDKSWDDVERKAKPVQEIHEFKKQLILDQEKSKLSLAQVYEQEYIKQREALDPDADEKPEEEIKEHTEIRSLMSSLFTKLNALCHFHYTPSIAAPEVKIISNVPAITMEEVAPLATSDATLLAPEEIKAKNKGNIIGQTERTDTDRKRERRQKKIRQREKEKEKQKRDKLIEKVRPGLGNKYSKEKMNKLLENVTKDRNVNKMETLADKRSLTSSTAFFTQLQDEVSSSIKTNSKKTPAKEKIKYSAKQLKL